MATANPFVFKRVKVKTSCKFATSPDILVTKRKNSVANATVLVALLSFDKQFSHHYFDGNPVSPFPNVI